MAIFMNKGEHPDMFKNQDKIKEPNLGYSRVNYAQEMVEEQKKLNKTMLKSLSQFKQQNHLQTKRWSAIDQKLNYLTENSRKHEQFEQQASNWIEKFHQGNQNIQGMLQDEHSQNQEIMEQIQYLNESNQSILNHLDKYDTSNHHLNDRVEELFKLQQELCEEISEYDEKQNEVFNRLENQEALMEKVVRQMDNLRSIVYERVSHLTEKIEDGYKLTSSYLYKLWKDPDQPFPFVIDQKKQENR
ncbi:hypothetical protein [Salinibacillus xinjiangensis]|uniref:Uncharacterized protein n=1 Tax=Salinibacillus xinjiangensis TaxID=1229268 RepID=A0A6G1XAC0_9BACI|nr:hypothetical protein [Salinibacillus xinjiangensis]MRG87855.1 hypothetical protein [Salinibacillus xinjiangensis]